MGPANSASLLPDWHKMKFNFIGEPCLILVGKYAYLSWGNTKENRSLAEAYGSFIRFARKLFTCEEKTAKRSVNIKKQTDDLPRLFYQSPDEDRRRHLFVDLYPLYHDLKNKCTHLNAVISINADDEVSQLEELKSCVLSYLNSRRFGKDNGPFLGVYASQSVLMAFKVANYFCNTFEYLVRIYGINIDDITRIVDISNKPIIDITALNDVAATNKVQQKNNELTAFIVKDQEKVLNFIDNELSRCDRPQGKLVAMLIIALCDEGYFVHHSGKIAAMIKAFKSAYPEKVATPRGIEDYIRGRYYPDGNNPKRITDIELELLKNKLN